jgi:hypothetical protein
LVTAVIRALREDTATTAEELIARPNASFELLPILPLSLELPFSVAVLLLPGVPFLFFEKQPPTQNVLKLDIEAATRQRMCPTPFCLFYFASGRADLLSSIIEIRPSTAEERLRGGLARALDRLKMCRHPLLGL